MPGQQAITKRSWRAQQELAALGHLICYRSYAGVETLLEDAIAADPEWPKLLAVPQLMDGWVDVQTKWQADTDGFKV